MRNLSLFAVDERQCTSREKLSCKFDSIWFGISVQTIHNLSFSSINRDQPLLVPQPTLFDIPRIQRIHTPDRRIVRANRVPHRRAFAPNQCYIHVQYVGRQNSKYSFFRSFRLAFGRTLTDATTTEFHQFTLLVHSYSFGSLDHASTWAKRRCVRMARKRTERRANEISQCAADSPEKTETTT